MLARGPLFCLPDLLSIQVKAIRAEHGKKAFGPVLVDQLYGLAFVSIFYIKLGLLMSTIISGMRGLPALIWDGSVLDAGK